MRQLRQGTTVCTRGLLLRRQRPSDALEARTSGRVGQAESQMRHHRVTLGWQSWVMVAM